MQNSTSKLKLLEYRITTLTQLIENLERNIIAQDEKFQRKIELLTKEIMEIKKELSAIRTEVNAIMDQLPLFATKSRVDSLEKYLDLIDPMSFVTKKEVEKIVEKKIKEILKHVDYIQI